MSYEPKGVRFYDAASDREMLLVTEEGPQKDWICWRHPDGQWVTLRKATEKDRLSLARASDREAQRADRAPAPSPETYNGLDLLPHCSCCGTVLNCRGDGQHTGMAQALWARMVSLVAAVAVAEASDEDLRDLMQTEAWSRACEATAHTFRDAVRVLARESEEIRSARARGQEGK